MADMIQGAYDILNKHLGEEHRGKQRLPDNHRDLLKEIQGLVAYYWRCGIKHGMDIATSELLEYAKERHASVKKSKRANWETHGDYVSEFKE
jgi:hypothetical protein